MNYYYILIIYKIILLLNYAWSYKNIIFFKKHIILI